MSLSVEEKQYKYCPTCKNSLKLIYIDNGEYLTCSACGFIYWNNPKPVVSILLFDNDNILMLKRAYEPLKDYWCLPGGFIKYEETPEQAIIREAHEETGLQVKIIGLVGIYRIDNDPRGVHIDIIYYGLSKGNVKLSNEDNNYSYFKPHHLPQLIAYKHKKAIEDWAQKNNL